MAKTALQFRHNGRDVAIFVDGGTNLLVALRELIGDMTPKFGCGQGGCGACSVLIDGELHLSCLTLAETVAGRSVETLDGIKDGPELHPLQRAFMENFAAQCGYCTPGMLMAAKALLDRNPIPAAPRSSRRSPATSAAAPAMSRSSTPCSPPPPAAAPRLKGDHAGTAQGHFCRRAR